MDHERERIQDDLRGLVAGEVRCDDLTLAMYASDASVYEIWPLGVVCPRGVADVAACVRYAAENNLPVHPRGAGTGLAGGALGPGLVLDFSRHMRRIVGVEEGVARVQSGVVLASLNRAAAAFGHRFGPDPANEAVTTIGGVIAVNASGSRFARNGAAGDYVRSLQLVLSDGAVVEVGRESLGQNADDEAAARKVKLTSDVAEVLLAHHETIGTPHATTGARSAGYQLHGALRDGRVDFGRLLAGSEGTLAIVTEATLATIPRPQHVGVVLLLFDRLESAARAVEVLLPVGLSACDLLDRRHLGLARESDVRFDLLVPATVEAALVVEVDSDTPAELREKIAAIVRLAREEHRLAVDARSTIDPEEVELYWRLATRVVPRLYRLQGDSRPLPFVEDVVVPPPRLAEFLVELQNALKQRHVTASVYGHAAHGRMHVRPFLDLANDDDIGRMRVLADDLYRIVLDLGGAIGGELGAGLSRTGFLRRQHGALCDVFADVKRAFDPQGIFNPGKVVGDDPEQLTRNLRRVGAAIRTTEVPPQAVEGVETVESAPPRATIGSPNVVELQLDWREPTIDRAARSCNGCGACRTQLLPERMCPINRAAPREEASPRAKANLLRAVLSGRIERDSLPSDEFKQVADLCVHCHQCRLECPAEVDIPKLMVEARAAHVAHSGLRPSEWLLTRLDLVGSMGGLVRPLANWALGNRSMRWLFERFFGLAHGRKLPKVARRSFLRRAARRKLTRPNRAAEHKVLYFADVYANYFDPQIGEALVAVLEHNGVSVYVPKEPMQSGMAMVAMGAVERARQLAAANVAILADAVRQGFHIVATEPAAALCLTHEYPNLLDDDEVRLVAANTSEACTYLWRMHLEKRLRLDLQRIDATVAYHQPCHSKALRVGTPAEHLLGLIPGLTVLAEKHGCSGMAGTFGLVRKNYRTSLRVGWELISWLRQGTMHAGVTECSTCKLQMEQGTTRPTIHPLKLLAHAYGRLPQGEKLLAARSSELIVT
ncbi:MAG: anaerobic glycerol-3-phosphate dehydrogenase subunit C [Planctomycetota bacterium]|nr:MAG: anaerobic glycerol-3-phosphate dehydrogenase subunit C [Planctomycetota bacterium]